MQTEKRAVFFDRDGTLIEERHYLKDPAGVVLSAGAAECLRALKEAGFLLIVVSNQSGVARGMMTEEDVRRVNARLCELTEAAGAPLDAVYYCPHLAGGTVAEYAVECGCRKPKPGMAARAAAELDVDLARSYMVGDKAADVFFGKNGGMRRSFLVGTGYGAAEKEKISGVRGAEFVSSLREAAEKILADK